MSRSLPGAVLVLSLCGSGTAAAEEAGAVRHRPVDRAIGGRARLWFEVDGADRAGMIVVRFGPSSLAVAEEVVAVPDHGAWVADLPAESVRPPGFVYWAVDRRPDGSERPLFASRGDPQAVAVDPTPDGGDGGGIETRALARVAIFGAGAGRNATAGLDPAREGRSFTGFLAGSADPADGATRRLHAWAVPLEDGALPIAKIDWFVAPVLRLAADALSAASQAGDPDLRRIGLSGIALSDALLVAIDGEMRVRAPRGPAPGAGIETILRF